MIAAFASFVMLATWYWVAAATGHTVGATLRYILASLANAGDRDAWVAAGATFNHAVSIVSALVIAWRIVRSPVARRLGDTIDERGSAIISRAWDRLFTRLPGRPVQWITGAGLMVAAGAVIVALTMPGPTTRPPQSVETPTWPPQQGVNDTPVVSPK